MYLVGDFYLACRINGFFHDYYNCVTTFVVALISF